MIRRPPRSTLFPYTTSLPAGTALLAAAGEFVYGCPGPCFRGHCLQPLLLVAGFNVFRLPLLFGSVAGFVALRHGWLLACLSQYNSMVRASSGFHGEADLDGHLPVIHFSLADIAARFDYLVPAQEIGRAH